VPSSGATPFKFIEKLYGSQTKVFQAADGEDLTILACKVFDWSTHVTDRETNRIAMAKMRYSSSCCCAKKCRLVLYLSEFFIEVRSACHCRRISVLMVHVSVLAQTTTCSLGGLVLSQCEQEIWANAHKTCESL